jgi:hypothetical protein
MNDMDSPYTLLLGFSCSLAPDGSPGSYNKDIAAAMCQWIAQRGGIGDDVLLAAQWEIVDALKSQHDDVLPFAVKPPTFKPSDVINANRLVSLLRARETEGARELSKLLCVSLRRVGYESHDDAELLDRAGLNAERLVMYLNGLLSDIDDVPEVSAERGTPRPPPKASGGARLRGSPNASWRRSASPISDNPCEPVDY